MTNTAQAMKSFQKIADNINYMNEEYQPHYLLVTNALADAERMRLALEGIILRGTFGSTAYNIARKCLEEVGR